MKSAKTPSELLIECLEQFGTCEPKKILVIYLDDEDMLRWSSNGLLDHEKIGLIRVVEHAVLTGAGVRTE